MNPQVPTGNTTEVVKQYYNYLYSIWVGKIQQTFFIHWEVIGWVVLWIFVLAGGFYVYTRWQRYTHVPKEPYPVESYNGYIQETNGPVGAFLTVFYIAMFIWLVLMTISNLIVGQVY